MDNIQHNYFYHEIIDYKDFCYKHNTLLINTDIEIDLNKWDNNKYLEFINNIKNTIKFADQLCIERNNHPKLTFVMIKPTLSYALFTRG